MRIVGNLTIYFMTYNQGHFFPKIKKNCTRKQINVVVRYIFVVAGAYYIHVHVHIIIRTYSTDMYMYVYVCVYNYTCI